MPIGEQLSAERSTIVRTPGPRGIIEWDVQRLDPETAMRNMVFYSSLGVAIAQQETSAQRLLRLAAAGQAASAAATAQLKAEQALELELSQDAPDQARIAELQVLAREARRSLQRAKTEFMPRYQPKEREVGQLLERQQQIVAACVQRARDEGEQWEPIRIVLDEASSDPAANVVWVGLLDDDTFEALLAAATQPLREAGKRWARFRGGGSPSDA